MSKTKLPDVRRIKKRPAYQDPDRLIDRLRQRKAARSTFHFSKRTTLQAYQGPLPPPSMLREYEKVCPGLVEKVVDMAKEEQDHSHFMDKVEWRYRFWGLFLAVVFLFSLLGGAIWSASIGSYGLAVTIVGAMITCVIAAIAGHDNLSSALKNMNGSKNMADKG